MPAIQLQKSWPDMIELVLFSMQHVTLCNILYQLAEQEVSSLNLTGVQ